MRFLFGFCMLFSAGMCADECQLPLDIVFLQDTTLDVASVVPNMIDAIPQIYSTLIARFPDSKIGLAEFQDKPYPPLGHVEGICYNLMAMLHDNTKGMLTSYESMKTLSGTDIPEAQYQAIISLVLDATVGWRQSYRAGQGMLYSSSTGGRYVIMSTDSRPHLNGDMASYTAYPEVPQGLPENSGKISTDDTDFECLQQEYPSPQQLKDALTVTKTKLIILTPDDAGLAPVWRWVNEDLLGQPEHYYQFIASDASDVYDAVMRAMAEESFPVPCPLTTTSTSPLSTISPDCHGCPCPPNKPCKLCAPECDAEIVMRFANEPKKMQVIVNNESAI